MEKIIASNIKFKISNYIKKYKKINLPKKNFENSIPFIINYVKLLRNNLIINHNFINEIIEPKLSIITTVHNKENYLKPFLSSIQNQNLKEIEIIIVDDASTDKSVEIIKEFIQKDKRIKLIKNKVNRGSLYARYKGAIMAKGNYILFADSDDIILKDGIYYAYNYITNNKLDMIQFHSIFQYKDKVYVSRRYYKFLNVIYQPLLSYVFYYNKNKGAENNTALWDKLIKKEVVLNSFKFIGEKYYNDRIIIENDVLILFSLFRNCKSYKYIDEIGYYYVISNNDSITNTHYKPEQADQIIHSIFTNIKFLYEKTDNSYLDKCLCIFKLIQSYKRYNKYFKYIKIEFFLIENILDKLIYSQYISSENKIIINSIKNSILKFKLK